MSQKLILWVEDYLFYPNAFQKLISFLLLPLTFIYLLIISFKKMGVKKIDFGIPVISIGNLIVGGSGKTPFVIELTKDRENIAIVLRGYGRASKGLYIISNKGNILEDISISGDEAMLLANKLPNATIIVSENRKEAIVKAKELGCEIVFLDDGFSKYDIKKFDILLKPKKEPENIFCLPSGGYREPKMMYSYADLILQEGIDFERIVSYKLRGEVVSSLPLKLVLLTAISKPKRLLDFLPESTVLEAFEDHHTFTRSEIDEILERYKDYKIITTSKDLVKLEQFNIKDIYLMDLSLNIKKDISSINEYINS
ncbi:MAG: tetraacyldisaccharide 4'-kinase [Campylobacteraceae bacterium]|nr:tetraacyldisaccharide 4'-kinase [Campylobacteraceae bacterium]